MTQKNKILKFLFLRERAKKKTKLRKWAIEKFNKSTKIVDNMWHKKKANSNFLTFVKVC